LPLGEKTRLPIGLDLSRDVTQAGVASEDIVARVSANALATNFTNSLSWHADPNGQTATGALQVSRRVAGFGLSGQLAYLVKPESKLTSLAVSTNKELDANQRITVDLLRYFDTDVISLGGGWTRNYGSFGLSLSGRYGTDGQRAVGVQLFTSLGRDPRSQQMVSDWQPFANTGAVAARVFVDANQNGVYDPGEDTIENAGFVLNGGGRSNMRTNPNGLAYLNRLTPHQYTDIALDPATLEDPQWVPEVAGLRVLPRAGKAQVLDFPVVMTADVDGMVYLQDLGKRRGIGAAEVELIDAQGSVVASARSSSDGYYVVQAVHPGQYHARISPTQLQRLGMRSSQRVAVVIKADGTNLNGLDFTVQRAP